MARVRRHAYHPSEAIRSGSQILFTRNNLRDKRNINVLFAIFYHIGATHKFYVANFNTQLFSCLTLHRLSRTFAKFNMPAKRSVTPSRMRISTFASNVFIFNNDYPAPTLILCDTEGSIFNLFNILIQSLKIKSKIFPHEIFRHCIVILQINF